MTKDELTKGAERCKARLDTIEAMGMDAASYLIAWVAWHVSDHEWEHILISAQQYSDSQRAPSAKGAPSK